MNRFLISAAAAAAVLLALRHPAPAPAGIAAVATAAPSQHSRKGHPARSPAPAAVVYVTGAVPHAGLYSLPASARVHDAVQRAGGLRPDADPAGVNLAQRVSDGEEIDVPRKGETPLPHRRTRRQSRRTASPPPDPVDLNAADASALSGLPGIGQTLASRIVEYRALNGPFASLDELLDVAGMTQRRVDALVPYVTLHDAP